MAAKKKATTKKACGGKVKKMAEGGILSERERETMQFDSGDATRTNRSHDYRDYDSYDAWWDALGQSTRESFDSGTNIDYQIQHGMAGTGAAKRHFGIAPRTDTGNRPTMYTPVSEAGTNPGYEEQYGGGRRPRANVPDSGSSSFWEQHNQLSGNTPSSPPPTSDSGTRTIVTPGSGSQDNRTPTGTTSRMSPDIEVKPVTSARYYKDGGYVTNDVNGCMNGSCDHPSRIKTLHRKS